ncbi:MAG: type II toxin-antitoxin system RelE/ParE family toxin [Bacteroidales bacterium]|nr:type II toxin-antitoxin system RelE/ParE family toxin [Bacteroidales bacterium]
MDVFFNQQYLADLYLKGDGGKKHRFQPQIIRKYVQIVDLMKALEDVSGLLKYKSLRYEQLKGDKLGTSSLRINDQYRIEFVEEIEEGKIVATICTITELSNHYK